MKDCKKIQQLIDMFYDKELLTEDNKKELFAHIEKCQECNNLFNELNQFEKELSSCEKFSPPGDFTYRVMEALQDKSEDTFGLSGLKDVFLSPLALRINLAIVTGLLMFIAIRPYVLKNNKETISTGNIFDSNLSNTTANARFYIELPANFKNIESVSVVGDFNRWDRNSFKLKSKGQGIWEGTFYIKPGKYEYMFVINGEKWLPDPKAKEFKDDGFGKKNSVLIL